MFSFRRLPRGKIDGEPHPVDGAERPVLGQTVPGIEHHELAVVQRILRQTVPWNGNASQAHYSLLRTDPPPRSVLDVIRRCECRTTRRHRRLDAYAGLDPS